MAASKAPHTLPEWVNPLSELGSKNLIDLNIRWFWEKCAKTKELQVERRVNKMFYAFWKTHEIAAEVDSLSEENLKLQMRRRKELSAELPIETALSPILEHQISGFYYLAGLLLDENVNMVALKPIKQALPAWAMEGALHVMLKAWLRYKLPRRNTFVDAEAKKRIFYDAQRPPIEHYRVAYSESNRLGLRPKETSSNSFSVALSLCVS
ncbi:hypothetical protein CROQUDRAFT_718855 [Cronartium quercuum f. sp. fusiforme G11]|uniref:Uncharacterized protein n=1 Tax=Cronartium quercuum f. sp. fusiforme G11 TaxID=708437 RepID=A0A9P6N911_9BASI|nr:hypothetical protein CROQUDRAFT_718855 [Cronartium quercuum f. sp. fusiforme G11]